MNTITKLIWAILAGIVMLWVGGATPADATKPPTVHHPACPAGWTQIKDQPPHSGKSVTAAYSGTVWIKVATIHFEVPVVAKGDVITPQAVSSWPTNRNGKFQDVSHVDYCIPPVDTTTTSAPEQSTTTSVQETTTTLNETTTTVQQSTTTQPLPPITGPASVPSTVPIPDECWIGNNQANALPAGSFTFYNDTSNPGATGTHSISGIPCGPVVDASTTTSPLQTELPDTGSENWAVVLVALMSMSLGGAALWAARR
jgi:LPXTG-motif cell wall-anchored protein